MIRIIKVATAMVYCLFLITSCSTSQNIYSSNTDNQSGTTKNMTIKPKLSEANRVLFLGDSITYQGDMIVNIELWLKNLYPNKRFELINIGLPSETITGLSEDGHANGEFPRPYLHDRLNRILEKVQPDLIISMYGINCGIYQSFSNQHDMLFQHGYLTLHKAISALNIPTLYITPPMYDHVKGNTNALDYNDKVLSSFSRWLLSNKKNSWEVIDFYSAMNSQLTAIREKNPDFFFQHDGIHMVSQGYWLLSDLIMNYFEPDLANKLDIPIADLTNAKLLAQSLSNDPNKLLSLTTEKMNITRNAWLRYTKHTRPNLAEGLSMNEMKTKVTELNTEIDKLIGNR